MEKKNQQTLFDKKEWWEEHWQDMPEFVQEDLSPFSSILVHFANREDMSEFAKLVEQHITSKTQSIWFPKAKIRSFKNKVYVTKGYKKNDT